MRRRPPQADPNTLLLDTLADPVWRLRHLYRITDKRGARVQFIPNPAQERLLSRLHTNNVILKARQMGFSTAIQLIMLDAAVFVPGTQATVIAHTAKAASKIFRRVIKAAYDDLPAPLRQAVRIVNNSMTELVFSNGSSVTVAVTARSEVLQYLHVSELGKIAATDPSRAYEIMTGSITTVAKGGFVFVESTAEGAEGLFFDLCQRAMGRQDDPAPLTLDDWQFHFFAWWEHPAYRRAAGQLQLTPDDLSYFAQVEAQTETVLDHAQRQWYVQKLRNTFGGETDAMHREYPSYPEEAFLSSKSGAFYTTQLQQARQDGRLTDVPWDPRYPVDTWWDLGGDGTPVVYTQRVGPWTHVIDYQETFAAPYQDDVRLMLAKPYTWGTHHLPHDGINKPKQAHANLSALQQLTALGLRNIVPVPRIARVIDGIQETRRRFAELRIDQTRCAKLIVHLTKYRKTWSEKLAGFTDIPVHDIHSHGADALRQWAQTPNDTHVNVRAPQRSGV